MALDAVKTVQLIDTIYMLKDAWGKVTKETISHCFNHAGWKAPDVPRAADLPAFPAPDNMTDEEWQSFVEIDSDLETVGQLEDSEITNVVKKRRIDPELTAAGELNSEDEDEEPARQISRLQVNEAFETLRTYLQMNCLEDARVQLQAVEAAVTSYFQ